MTALDIGQWVFNGMMFSCFVYLLRSNSKLKKDLPWRVRHLDNLMSEVREQVSQLERKIGNLQCHADAWAEVAGKTRDKLDKVEYLLDKVSVSPK